MCTVKPGTKIFVVGFSWECSTFNGDHFDYGVSEGQLRACARAHDVPTAPPVTVDGRAISLNEVETAKLPIALPENNIFLPDPHRTGYSVAHGWVALLNPMTPGRHEIVIVSGVQPVSHTSIVVQQHA